MGTIPSQTDRSVIDGTEYVAASAGGFDRKLLVSKIRAYVLAAFSNKTQLDKISESGGLPQYDSKPFGSLVFLDGPYSNAESFSVALNYSRIIVHELDDPAEYAITFTSISIGVILVLKLQANAAVTFAWNADIKWVDGEPLLSLASGEEARLYIASDGTTNAGITINWVKVSTYAGS